MELSTWLLFSGIALVSIISPGPAVFLSITNSLTHGLTKSIISSFGNIIGILIVSGATVMGLGAVLNTSLFLFTVLKIIGAMYLIYLGIRQWRTKINFMENSSKENVSAQGKQKIFIQGILVAVSNPKAVLFFTALLPQFIDLSRPITFQFMVLTLTFMIFSFLTLVIYAKSANIFKSWFAIGNRATWFNRISGMIFVTFGLGILRIKNRAI